MTSDSVDFLKRSLWAAALESAHELLIRGMDRELTSDELDDIDDLIVGVINELRPPVKSSKQMKIRKPVSR